MSLIVIAYCQRNSSESPKPGVSTNHIQLNAVRAVDDPVDPNNGLLDANGGFGVQINGATKEAAANFTSGKKCKILIEEIE